MINAALSCLWSRQYTRYLLKYCGARRNDGSWGQLGVTSTRQPAQRADNIHDFNAETNLAAAVRYFELTILNGDVELLFCQTIYQ